MKRLTNVMHLFLLLIMVIIIVPSITFSQGNSNGNSNSNNNANGNALKWETQGNNADTSDFIGTTNQTALKMRTNNQERMRITPDGRIGLGISNPLERFELQGNLKLTGDVIFSSYATINDPTEKLLFVDGEGRTNVKTLNQLKNLIYADPYDGFVSACDLAGTPLQLNPTWVSGPYKLYTRCPDIKVGIGTETPEFTLHTIGEGYFTQGIRLGTTSSTSSLPALIQGNHNINNTRPWIRFTAKESNGNENTTFLVQKDGALYCTSVRVRLREDIPVPDYVFQKDYQLMPLSQLKEFINKNYHLPNIPSEKQVKENGLSLEEMQLKLLEKVEELTLYVIELDEENKRLNEKIKEIENQ